MCIFSCKLDISEQSTFHIKDICQETYLTKNKNLWILIIKLLKIKIKVLINKYIGFITK